MQLLPSFFQRGLEMDLASALARGRGKLRDAHENLFLFFPMLLSLRSLFSSFPEILHRAPEILHRAQSSMLEICHQASEIS